MGGGILYRFSTCVTFSIFRYSALFHECLGYYIYLLLFPIFFYFTAYISLKRNKI